MTDTDDRVERVARAICQSRSCEGVMCCQWPAQTGRRHLCPVDRGGYTEAARAALAAADQWRPIETAPKDGSSILVADARGRVHEANWQNDWYGDESNPGWMPANLDEEYGSYIAAVAWMPMPRAPEAK